MLPSRLPLGVLSACLLAAACSSGGGGPLLIQSCSLGCSDAGGQISCSFVGIHVNEEIRVVFSDPIDLASVTKNSFKVTAPSGIAPVGEYRLGATPNVVVFRPVITFDSAGNPLFGLQANESYRVEIPGTTVDSQGPFVRSVSGAENAVRLDCTLLASEGVLDQAPGPPSVSVRVDQVTAFDPLTGEPTDIQPAIANAGVELTNVYRESDVRLVFDDIMNPATLTNPVSGLSDFIRVLIDPDGDTADDSDQLPLFGTFLPPVIDNDALETTLVFRFTGGLPSAGSAATKRRVVVKFSPLIRDLGGNPLLDTSPVSFVPEVLQFTESLLPVDPAGLGERFLADGDNLDEPSSAAGTWGATEDPSGTVGLLASGPEDPGAPGTYLPAAGGSGRIGALVVLPGETRLFGTDGTLAQTIEGIPVAPKDSPFFQYVLVGGGPAVDTVPVQAFGRVRWEQQQVFGLEPDWIALGFSGPPTIAVQVEAEDPVNPGEFSPVWMDNDGVTPLILDVQAAAYTNTPVIDNYDPDTELPGSGFYSADAGFGSAEGTGGDASGANGVFEFSSVEVRTGGRLAFAGESPVRLFTRGMLDLRGTLDVSGGDGPAHRSDLRLGSPPVKGGPGGGDGGGGGDRYDHAQGAFEFLDDDALPIPGKISAEDAKSQFLVGIDNVDDFDLEGRSGEGIGGSTDPAMGGGAGSTSWPEVFPGEVDESTYSGLLTDFGDFGYDFACISPQVSAPGGGGAFVPGGWGVGSNGGVGIAKDAFSVGFLKPPVAPDTPGPDTSGIDPAAVFDPEAGMPGGAGGGGSGTHINLTKSNAAGIPLNCTTVDTSSTPPLRIDEYSDHSGAAGGGGGGAIQVQAGRTLLLSGTIDAKGGDGGEATKLGDEFQEYRRRAIPGGGGSGGNVLLQGNLLQIAAIVGRLDLRGGVGGSTLVLDDPVGGPRFSVGGDGGAGVARLEVTSFSTQDVAALASTLISGSLILPGAAEFPAPASYPPILSSGVLVPPAAGPGAFSGAQSCWMRPEGNFFQVEFREDEPGGELGWDMTVVFANGDTESYRSVLSSGPFAGLTLEEVFGSTLRDPDAAATVFDTSPIVVRFQGARSVDDIPDPCEVPLQGDDSPILAGSLTPWVYHPAELNDYWESVPGVTGAQAAQRRSNMVRFQVVFDRAHPFAGTIAGVTRLSVRVLPD